MSLSSLPRAISDALRHAEGVTLSRFSTIDPVGGRAMSVASERFPASAAPPLTRTAGDTPLPALSIAVLSISLMGEFLTANVSMPFLLFMVKGFTDMQGVEDVSSFTGALLASFFVGQFVTSLLWANIAQCTNNRLVLTLSLFGTTASCCLFGMSTNLTQAMVVRLFQGVFAGAIGVSRGSVSGITDVSNENRAYAILGFCWGLGGVAGAVIGGIFESPASKWPSVFGSLPLFVTFPYLLPTLIAASVTCIGGILSCFLAPDGGPRNRTLLPPAEKTVVFAIPPTIHEGEPLLTTTTTAATGQLEHDAEAGERPSRIARGYGAITSGRNASRQRSIDSSRCLQRKTATSQTSLHEAAGLVERVALANENHVSQISDLWVAGAMTTDLGEEDRDGLEEGLLFGHDGEGNFDTGTFPALRTLSWPDMIPPIAEQDTPNSEEAQTPTKQPPFPAGRGPLPSDFGACTRPLRRPARVSSLSRRTLTLSRTQTQSTTGWGRGMNARTLSLTQTRTRDWDADDEDEEDEDEKGAKSPMWTLPWLVILQYGLLALHSVTHDMVFMSFFFSEVKLGGLGLTASNFSLLTAVMCVFQIGYQFYLYPTLGAHLSHLSMLQLGTGMFCIAFIASPILHFLATSGEPGVDLSAGLIIVTAIRYGGTTFGYTAVAILVNRMSPPPIVGLANGIAQSVVSLARCFGPLLGGYMWSAATDGNPSGIFVPFFTLCGMGVFALVTSLAIQ